MDSGSEEASEEVSGEDLDSEEAGDGAGAQPGLPRVIRLPGQCLTAIPFLMAILTGWDIRRPILISPGPLRPALNRNNEIDDF